MHCVFQRPGSAPTMAAAAIVRARSAPAGRPPTPISTIGDHDEGALRRDLQHPDRHEIEGRRGECRRRWPAFLDRKSAAARNGTERQRSARMTKSTTARDHRHVTAEDRQHMRRRPKCTWRRLTGAESASRLPVMSAEAIEPGSPLMHGRPDAAVDSRHRMLSIAVREPQPPSGSTGGARCSILPSASRVHNSPGSTNRVPDRNRPGGTGRRRVEPGSRRIRRRPAGRCLCGR